MNPEETTPSEMTLQEAVNSLMSDLPAPIRRFIASPDRDQITIELSKKYALHIDQAGEFERLFVLMLLGALTPEEFVQSLRKTGLTAEQVTGLTADINQQVFMRLRTEERAETTSQKLAAPPPPAPRPSVPIYSPLPEPTASVTPPTYVTQAIERPVPKQVPPPSVLPGQMPEAVQPHPTPAPPQRIEVPKVAVPPPQQAPMEKSATPQTDPNARIIHTMARDMQAMKSGTDPMRVAHPAPPAWATAPNPQPMQPPAPPAAPPPPVPPPQPLPQHDAPRTQEPSAPKVPQAITHHLKQYGVDPYREPVE